MVQCALKRKW